MTAAESRYQKLRGHLHYLRLEAAAEALPQELERARKEKLSHTAFLEHLLAIEVEATEARRLAGRLRFASLPACGCRKFGFASKRGDCGGQAFSQPGRFLRERLHRSSPGVAAGLASRFPQACRRCGPRSQIGRPRPPGRRLGGSEARALQPLDSSLRPRTRAGAVSRFHGRARLSERARFHN